MTLRRRPAGARPAIPVGDCVLQAINLLRRHRRGRQRLPIIERDRLQLRGNVRHKLHTARRSA